MYLAGGVRTPFGAFGGALAEVSAAQLGATAIKAVLSRTGIPAQDIGEVFFGNVIGAGQGQNIARQCSLGAGVPKEVGCTTINKVCGSALKAIVSASQAIQCRDAEMVIAGGTESMSRAPYLLEKARTGYRMGNGELVDAMIHDGLWDVYKNVHMGQCGDLCARKYNFTRQQQDDYAIESYKRAQRGWETGFFKELVVPVEVKTRKGVAIVDRDEEPFKFVEERFRSLPPAFGPESQITAGNSSGISDGAAACLVISEEKMKSLGVKPMGRILGYANVALDPDWFTIAPIYSIRKLADQLSLKLSDVDLFEINEAFSVVAMVAMKELGLEHAKVNVNGGAVSIGHPIGASGARITITLLQALRQRGGKLGIASLCIGGGEALAIAVENCA